MKKILRFIKKLVPEQLLIKILPLYHAAFARFAAFWYGYPSKKMIVIGVTGTKGKSTTTQLIAKVLEKTGEKVGFTSTAGFQIAEKQWLNDKKMTMLGRFALQKLLNDMVKVGCKYAVIETSSEGIKQSRHIGINYDWLIFTNLTPEHIESHGNFEKYKMAKLELFRHLENSKHKIFKPKRKTEKMIIVNGDDKYAKEFLNFKADKKEIFSAVLGDKNVLDKNINCRDATIQSLYKAENIKINKAGISFSLGGNEFSLNLLGEFNVYNAMPAIMLGRYEGLDWTKIKKAFWEIKKIPGRMEFIDEGQNFDILVDYAHEPASMAEVFATLKILRDRGQINKIIHIFGSCGGGRDHSRRASLGRISGQNADVSIITNEDPYDDPPTEIINEVAKGAISIKQEKEKNVLEILDRREAIRKAFELAQEGDLVLITGKGDEQYICEANGKKVPWDDRKSVREEVKKLFKDKFFE